MAQHDYILENASGSVFRQDLNNVLRAIATQNSGTTAPTTTHPYMVWADTTNDLLKIRNAADTDWVSLYILSTGAPLGGAGADKLVNIVGADVGVDYLLRSHSRWAHEGYPTTLQVPANPWWADGASFSKGDIFIGWTFNNTAQAIYGGLCVALKDFTCNKDLGIPGHRSRGDVFQQAERTLALSSTNFTSGFAITATDLTQYASGYVKFTTLTFNEDTTVTTASTPQYVDYFECIFLPPWKMFSEPNSIVLPGFSSTSSRSGIPIMPSNTRGVTSFSDKTNSFWVFANYLVGAACLDEHAAEGSYMGLIYEQGASMPFEHLEGFCTTPPADGNTIYYIGTTQTSTSTDIFNTSPLDGNSIAIGTYVAATKTLTVSIS